MAENVTESSREGVVTLENLPQMMSKVAILREEHGKDFSALRLARQVRDEAIKLGSNEGVHESIHEMVVDLYWEDYLIGTHLRMRVRDEKGSDLKKALFNKYGLYLMKDSSEKALVYIDEHGVETRRARSNRYSGILEVISKKYTPAIIYIDRGISLYQQMEDPKERWNALEIKGFKAEALILSGRLREGIRLAVETFGEYDKDEGLLMKETKYYQWAVWKSGCIFKIWNAILHDKHKLLPPERDELEKLLDQAVDVLQFPDGSESDGKYDFAIRKAEAARIKGELGMD